MFINTNFNKKFNSLISLTIDIIILMSVFKLKVTYNGQGFAMPLK